MPENLIAYGFARDDEESVQSVIGRVENLISSRGNDDGDMRDLINQLRQIKDEVDRREADFYDHFGVSGYDELNEKLKKIERAYEPLLSGGSAVWGIRKQIDFSEIKVQSSPEEVAEAIDAALDQFMAEGGREEELLLALEDASFGDDERERVGKFIQMNLKLDDYRSSTGRKGRFVLSRGGTTIGLGKIITGYDPDKRKFTLKTEGQYFSSDFKKRLQHLIDVMLPTRKQKKSAKSFTPSQFRSEVNKIALSYITDKEARSRIQAVMRRKSQFDLMPNIASVTGYLGEIRAVALLEHLLPNGTNIRGTGRLRDAMTGGEIPIDIVCASFGFQIKNYRVVQNKASFSHEMLAGNMLKDRMCFSGPIYETLLSLFGVYQYNQPFHEPTDLRGRDWDTMFPDLGEYIDMYNKIYNNNNSLFYQLTPFFDAKIPDMIRVRGEFSVKKDADFTNRAMYFNTFYWINKHLVPSSYLLEKLIEQLEDNADKIVYGKYSLSNPVYDYQLQKQPRALQTDNMFTAANKLKMSYDITIDLSKFMD